MARASRGRIGRHESARCPKCRKIVSVRRDGLLFTHRVDGEPCDGSGGTPARDVVDALLEAARRRARPFRGHEPDP